MEFSENDLVVVTGFIQKNKSKKIQAKIFEVRFVGLEHLLVSTHENKYSSSTIKVKKSECIKIKPKFPLNESSIEPTIGSLVLVYETDWKGNITDKFIGHVEEIRDIPGKPKSCVVLTNNKRKESDLDSVLLLEL